ncbi:saccharopine dehydrogenase [Gordonia sp. OPL2]|uniref:saccharopine dehydrogenase n=1 Tax=Gordonia sp. OPL2 TaxID=2486274 RepID=UPI0016560053|nr:saccharopine dehydrogenase [Gordonia sp. OPL2]ROZ93799.1 saccharopine dehydrogenase [Gordonia sp. OPL2]
MRALVLGGRGAVGSVVGAELGALGHDVVPTGRSVGIRGLRIDLRTPPGLRTLASAAADHDVVVNASGIEDVAIRQACEAIPFVDMSASGDYLDRLADLPVPTATVLGAGLAPGLTTVLVAALDHRPGDSVDVAILLGSGETHGAAAVAWTAGLAGRALYAAPEPSPVVNFRERRRFDAGSGPCTYLRADFPDHVLVGHPGGISVRSYLALGDRLSTIGLGIVGRLPRLRPLLDRAPHLGDDRWSVVVANRRAGQQISAVGRGQSTTTGRLVARAAIAAATSSSLGPVTMADVMDADDLRSVPGVRIDLG